MLPAGLILVPVLMAALALAVPWRRGRPWLLPATGVMHLGLTIAAWRRPGAGGSEWLALDALGRPVLLLVSGIFTGCSIYAVGYLRYRGERSNRVLCGCMLMMLAMMTLVIWSRHLGLLWVAIEATTLSSAPLIYFNHTARSIEATWKYLLIGSVGIAMALLGTFFLAYSAVHAGLPASLSLPQLLDQAPHLSRPWLRAAAVLLLVGYGTKMGLAPMHTWKPDAYGEAPGMAGALLAGGMTSCAFLAILRVHQVCSAAGAVDYTGRTLVALGLVSMALAGVFMVGQRDFKRMLAYSSVEHMGILALGVGVGGAATFGALLHMINNGAVKTVLFLSAGNIHRAYESKSVELVRGAIRRVPVSGALFLAGFIAVTGSPPFGPFVSEFAILNGALGQGRYAVSGLYLAFLLLVFMGMGATVLAVVQGSPSPQAAAGRFRDTVLTAGPAVAFMGLVLLLGLWLPGPLDRALHEAVALLEAGP